MDLCEDPGIISEWNRGLEAQEDYSINDKSPCCTGAAVGGRHRVCPVPQFVTENEYLR